MKCVQNNNMQKGRLKMQENQETVMTKIKPKHQGE